MPFYENVEISGVAAEGKAIARIDNMVCFVNMAVPGDIVDLQVTRKRSHYMEARVTAFRKYSDIRQQPFCAHFGICGGCKWQHLPYSLQLRYKQQQVEDAIRRIGHVEIPPVQEIIGSPRDRFYRNKLEYTFSDHRWLSQEEIDTGNVITDTRALGFHIPGLFDKVVDIQKCWLQEEPSNTIRDVIRNYALSNGYTFFSQKEQHGFLRNLIIRTASTGEVMVVLSFFHDDEEKRVRLLDHLLQEVPSITSLMYVINGKGNDTLYDQDIRLFHGRDHIFENLEDLKFKIGPKSFFQTNTWQALKLYGVARDFAGLSGHETVYDLYTGTGTIANFLAAQAGKIVGIESVPESISDAIVNSGINGITNTHFFAGDMKDMLDESFVTRHGKPQIIITDPPRAGMHAKVVEQILNIGPEKIVYVSCNPATQARDIQLLNESYRVTALQPVDMFPQTHHVENVAKLERR